MSIVSLENPSPRPLTITVDLYHRMAEDGVFQPDERLELIDGQIFTMSPVGSLHVRCVNYLTNFLVRKLGDEFLVSVQNPIVSANDTEPQPDLTILRRRADLYKSQLPTGRDTAIVIEVADTTAAFDRNRKFPKYAQAGIPEAWLVDLKRDTVEIHTEPGPNGYDAVKVLRRGDRLNSTEIPAIELTVEDMLG